MANTYTQIHIQIVFAVKGRCNLIRAAFKEELERYITGIVKNKGHRLLAISCMPDHVHILLGFRPDGRLSDLVRDIKACSSAFVSQKGWVHGRFHWQEGYGAFSYSKSDVDAVTWYIRNQEQHHRKAGFKEEYLDLLRQFQIEHDSLYLFDWIDNDVPLVPSEKSIYRS